VTWLHWILMFIFVELSYYWAHRMCHEWNVMWAGHNVHHSSDEYNLFTALRQSPIQSLLTPCFYLPFAFFMPLRLFVAHRGINTVYQFWIHTRFIGKMWWPIEYVFNTPSHHRVHHGRNPQYIDKNYGGTLIVFDRLFGTFEPEGEEVVYGITHMPKSWNPIVLQLHHLAECVNVIRHTPNWIRKLRVLLDLGPSYNWRVMHYEELEVKKEQLPHVTIELAELDRHPAAMPNREMEYYGGVQAAVCLFEMLVSGVIGKNWPTPERALVVSHLLFSMYTVSACIDRHWYAAYIEMLRAVSCLPLVYFFLGHTATLALGVTGVYALGCIAWVWRYQLGAKSEKKKTKKLH